MIRDRRFSQRRSLPLLVLLLCTFLLRPAVVSAGGADARPLVTVIELHDTLQTERASVFERQLRYANREGATAVLVNLSSPGGLQSSTDAIIAAMHQSKVPVIVWAGSPQTRVSGEGLRLVAAADLAMMNPRTFLTPMWSDKPRQLSAQAQIAGSQRLNSDLKAASAVHHRSAAIVDELSSGRHWFSAAEAAEAGFVNGIAERSTDAVHLADGKTVERAGKSYALNLAGARLEEAKTEPQETLLLSLMNPDLSVLLLTLGLLLIYLEINTPGTVVPGAAGVLLALLAAFALRMLPLSAPGVALCVAAAILLLLEARFPSSGALAATGILALVTGLGLLVKGPLPQLQVSWGTAIGAGLGFGGVTATLVVLGVEARRAKVKTGSEAMLGWLAVAQTPLAPEGQILVRGELWRARMTTRDSFVAAGDKVKVLRADGLTLEVTAIPVSNAG